MKLTAQTFKKGFTLIELLVVIAVIGVLATIVLLAANPAEQLARGRDTSRISAITQLGRALQGYATANNATYPAFKATNDWMGVLTDSDDLKSAVGAPNYPSTTALTNCTTQYVQTVSVTNGTAGWGYCYQNTSTTVATITTATGVDAIVYTPLESSLYTSKCATGQKAWSVFATSLSKAGIACMTGTTEPTVANVTTLQ